MPYSIELPDGRLVEDIPDEVTPVDAKARIIKAYPQYGSKERTFGEAAMDIPASVAVGLGGLAKFPGQMYGLVSGAIDKPDFATTGLYGLGERLSKFGQEQKSEGLKTGQAISDEEAAQVAKEKGEFAAFRTRLSGLLSNPSQLASFLAEQIPQSIPSFLATLIPGLGPVAAAEIKALQLSASAAAGAVAKGVAEKALAEALKKNIAAKAGAAVGVGAAQQGADIGAGTYEDTYKELIRKGTSEPEAAKQAIDLARASGASATVISLLAQSLPGARALERAMAGERSGRGRLAGAALGILKETPSEMVEEVGGKFTQNLAMREVKPEQRLTEGFGDTAAQAAVGAAGLGGGIGALSGKKAPQPVAPKIEEDDANASRLIANTGGAGAGVSGQPGTDVSAPGGVAATQPDGVASAGPDATKTAVGAGEQPDAVTPGGTTNVPRTAKTVEERAQNFLNFSKSYYDLQSTVQGYTAITAPTPAELQILDTAKKDLSELVDRNAPGLVRFIPDVAVLKNPLFNPTQLFGNITRSIFESGQAPAPGQARALPGPITGVTPAAETASMFDKSEEELMRERIRASSTPAAQKMLAAVAKLEQAGLAGEAKKLLMSFSESKPVAKPAAPAQKQEKLDLSGKKFDAETADANAVADLDKAIQSQEAASKQAAAQLSADQIAPPVEPFVPGQFPWLGGDSSKTAPTPTAPEQYDAKRAEAPAAAEPRENVAEETLANIDMRSENVARTEEGKAILDFFDTIKSSSPSAPEQNEHAAVKRTATNTLLGYDIVGPNQTNSKPLADMLRYLANRVGGADKFNALLARLKEPALTPQGQSEIFRKAFLPDLTSRRGLREFQQQIQDYILATLEGVKGKGIPTKNEPAYSTGEFRGRIPYTEEIKTFTGSTQTYLPSESGKPRRPQGDRSYLNKHLIEDTKIRPAQLNLDQQVAATRGELGPRLRAAKSYLKRESFGASLKHAAYDYAHFNIDPKNHGAGWLGAPSEGGKYAVEFRGWIADNLDPSTLVTFDALVAEHQETYDAAVRFDEAVTEYWAALKKQVEPTIVAIEKQTNSKIPRAPRNISSRIEETLVDETETTPDVEVSKKNLPEVLKIPSLELPPVLLQMIKAGDLNAALELMARGSGYYNELAQRLIDANITAKTRIIGANVMEPINDTAATRDMLRSHIGILQEIIESVFPEDQRGELISGIKSNNLFDTQNALNIVRSAMVGKKSTESQKEVFNRAFEFINAEYNWVGKYNPTTDEILLREGSLTNHALFHETLHAAVSHLLDNHEKLTGVQKQGYEELVELYNKAKSILAPQGLSEINIYGLKDLHEFVSEALTNPRFQFLLRGIRYKASPLSLYNRFTNAVKNLFGVKKNTESNVMVETMLAADKLMAGTMSLEDITVSSGPKAMAGKRAPKPANIPKGLPNAPVTLGSTSLARLFQAKSWSEVKSEWPYFYASLAAKVRPGYLGVLTSHQINDLINKRLPFLSNFIGVTDSFLSLKNNILKISGDISERWERMQVKSPETSKLLADVMHSATIIEYDPDPGSVEIAKQTLSPEALTKWERRRSSMKSDPRVVALQKKWDSLPQEPKEIYRQVRKFYEDRYVEYRELLEGRTTSMLLAGLAPQTIADIRAEFEKSKSNGPYFPLMRHGRFWYQIGKGAAREFYMFEEAGERDRHLQARIALNPELEDTVGNKIGSEYRTSMDLHAKESMFLRSIFDAIDKTDLKGEFEVITEAERKQEMKDAFYQTWLANQPEQSFRNQFNHRQGLAGYSEDALRNFAGSSFHMAYQLSRFKYAPKMFEELAAARNQVKDRQEPERVNMDVVRENVELSDYVTEMEKRLKLILNPTDIGVIPSLLSNIGFIWYLTAPASAMVNVLGGVMIGLPTLVGQNVRANPGMSYTRATMQALGQIKSVTAQILGTGVSIDTGPRLRDHYVNFPSLSAKDKDGKFKVELSDVDRKAYDWFVADGVIDITATYDQSGLASAPTDGYTGISNRAMQAITALFHNAERFNREVMAMSAFRSAMEKRAKQKDQDVAFKESTNEAKQLTRRSMFDYSSVNKPRFFQHPVARVVLQFKQFPQQMTFFLAHNLMTMLSGAPAEVKREATARFVGTMGMTAILAGPTGVWGFNALAGILNAVFNNFGDEREEPFDFELEWAKWANEFAGENLGMLLTRGAFNALGADVHSRVKMTNMWMQDPRKNVDEVEAIKSRLIDLLGPSVSLFINAFEASKLYNEGHADRALETVMPAFIKNPLVAYRYSTEGVNTLAGDPLMSDMNPFLLLMQSLGLRSSELAERQFYNINTKGTEQEILKKRQNLLNLYGVSFMSNDTDANIKALDRIMDFNTAHPTVAIPIKTILKSIQGRLKKSSETDHGLFIDKRLRATLNSNNYVNDDDD